jgi:hypothetical protein
MKKERSMKGKQNVLDRQTFYGKENVKTVAARITPVTGKLQS